jgi:hypothetical protein
MCRQDLSFADTLYSLAQTSPTIQKLIDQAASDILALKKALGAFAPPLPSECCSCARVGLGLS